MKTVWVIEEKWEYNNTWNPTENVYLTRKSAREFMKRSREDFPGWAVRIRKYVSREDVVSLMAEIAKQYED